MNSFQHDTRVLKACGVSSDVTDGGSVMVVALGETGLPVEESVNDNVTVWRPQLASRSWPKNIFVQVIKYIEWLWRIVRRIRSEQLQLIHAHSLSALPVGVVAKWVTGAPVLYDAHELETEVVGTKPLRRRLSRRTERILIRWVDRMVTVCDSIADWYVGTYAVERPFVVRNVPAWGSNVPNDSNILRTIHHIPEDELIFLYQGALSTGRGVEGLLAAFSRLETRKHMIFMGYGVLESRILDAASGFDNIHFQRAVPPEELGLYTSSADVGVCLIEAVCLSNYYSLPNKLFEYLHSRVPILVTELPEQKSIVAKYDCGWIAKDLGSTLVELIDSIDLQSVNEKRRGVITANLDFSWQAEAQVLEQAYRSTVCDRILSNPPLNT
jgi:glycosyltransferase involved in cell wall biosynthesis